MKNNGNSIENNKLTDKVKLNLLNLNIEKKINIDEKLIQNLNLNNDEELYNLIFTMINNYCINIKLVNSVDNLVNKIYESDI